MKIWWILAILGITCSLFGIIMHNYEVDKCSYLNKETNTNYYDYELEDDCYFVLHKTGWNLFWNCFVFGFLGVLLLGGIGIMIDIMRDEI